MRRARPVLLSRRVRGLHIRLAGTAGLCFLQSARRMPRFGFQDGGLTSGDTGLTSPLNVLDVSSTGIPSPPSGAHASTIPHAPNPAPQENPYADASSMLALSRQFSKPQDRPAMAVGGAGAPGAMPGGSGLPGIMGGSFTGAMPGLMGTMGAGNVTTNMPGQDQTLGDLLTVAEIAGMVAASHPALKHVGGRSGGVLDTTRQLDVHDARYRGEDADNDRPMLMADNVEHVMPHAVMGAAPTRAVDMPGDRANACRRAAAARRAHASSRARHRRPDGRTRHHSGADHAAVAQRHSRRQDARADRWLRVSALA